MILQKPPVGVDELYEHLRTSLSPSDLEIRDPIHQAGSATLTLLPTRPDTVRNLAYKKLNVYPFKNVPICWRRAYEESCLWQLFKGLESVLAATTKGRSLLESWMDDAVELCDRAIIFTGAPARRRLIDEVLNWIDLNQSGDLSMPSTSSICKTGKNAIIGRPIKRRRLSDDIKTSDDFTLPLPSIFPCPSQCPAPLVKADRCIARLSNPSLDQFEIYMHETATPVILTNTIDHWPARERWPDPKYWHRRTLGGRRLVPVELGKSYTDDSWGQRIVNFREFMLTHLMHERRQCTAHESSLESSESNQYSSDPENGELSSNQDMVHEENPIGYLAQYDLLNQIPALRNDIAIPDYCYIDTPESTRAANVSNSGLNHVDPHSHIGPKHNPPLEDLEPPNSQEPLLNIWLGPTNTVSPAHTDPHHNILAQVFGRKYVRLFPPSESDKMYPMGKEDNEGDGESSNDDQKEIQTVDMGNTSRVDVGAFISFGVANAHGDKTETLPDHGIEIERLRFPKHESADFVEATLEPGECLYIPRGWWHYIRSLEPSCNVSFWWD